MGKQKCLIDDPGRISRAENAMEVVALGPQVQIVPRPYIHNPKGHKWLSIACEPPFARNGLDDPTIIISKYPPGQKPGGSVPS